MNNVGINQSVYRPVEASERRYRRDMQSAAEGPGIGFAFLLCLAFDVLIALGALVGYGLFEVCR